MRMKRVMVCVALAAVVGWSGGASASLVGDDLTVTTTIYGDENIIDVVGYPEIASQSFNVVDTIQGTDGDFTSGGSLRIFVRWELDAVAETLEYTFEASFTAGQFAPATIDISLLKIEFTDLDWVGTPGSIAGFDSATSPVVSSFTADSLAVELAADTYAVTGAQTEFFSYNEVLAFQTTHDNTGGDPVPEPTTMLLLSMGVAGLGVRKYRARNAGVGRFGIHVLFPGGPFQRYAGLLFFDTCVGIDRDFLGSGPDLGRANEMRGRTMRFGVACAVLLAVGIMSGTASATLVGDDFHISVDNGVHSIPNFSFSNYDGGSEGVSLGTSAIPIMGTDGGSNSGGFMSVSAAVTLIGDDTVKYLFSAGFVAGQFAPATIDIPSMKVEITGLDWTDSPGSSLRLTRRRRRRSRRSRRTA